MREVVLRVPRAAVEDVLDRLLLIVPDGVREVPAGRFVDLKLRGANVPSVVELKRAVGRWPVHVAEGQVPDDWRERRVADYEPDVIGGRVMVRPEWAPAGRTEIEIVLEERRAFGVGRHPTTRMCVEWLLALPVEGAFADLGCGTGVLSILAAKLGWNPVRAVDFDPEAVAAARANAALNQVRVEVAEVDLASSRPPDCEVFAANVQPRLHEVIASAWESSPPRLALLSGFGEDESTEVLGAYAERGWSEQRRLDIHGWTAALVKHD